VLHRQEEALDEGSEVNLLACVELRALEFDDGQERKKILNSKH
jgi:hypothetical protein